MKKVLPIIIALFLAALATFGIVNWSQQVGSSSGMKSVVVATTLLEAGSTIDQAVLSTGQVYYPQESMAGTWNFVFDKFVDPANMGAIEGRELAVEVQAGQPILEYMLKPIRREFQQVDWINKIPDERRAISIPVNDTQAVNGLIEVGDKVDILVTLEVPVEDDGPQQRTTEIPIRMNDMIQNIPVSMGGEDNTEPLTFYLMQDVEILAVGTQTYRVEEIDTSDPLAALGAERSGTGGITVAVTPQEALMFAFAVTQGNSQFTLVLRGPNDRTQFDTNSNPPWSLEEMLRRINYEP